MMEHRGRWRTVFQPGPECHPWLSMVRLGLALLPPLPPSLPPDRHGGQGWWQTALFKVCSSQRSLNPGYTLCVSPAMSMHLSPGSERALGFIVHLSLGHHVLSVPSPLEASKHILV